MEISKELRQYGKLADEVYFALKARDVNRAIYVAEESEEAYQLMKIKPHYRELLELLSGKARGHLRAMTDAVLSGAKRFPEYDEKHTPIRNMKMKINPGDLWSERDIVIRVVEAAA